MGYARTIWITIGADGRLAWSEGELVVPKGFDGKVEGYPEGTVVEVHGSYTRVDAHTKTLEIQRLKVAETPVGRTFELWRRLGVLIRPVDDPRSRPEWPDFVAALHAIRGDASPKAIMLRAWHAWVSDDRDEAMHMFGEALTLDTIDAEPLVRTLWQLASNDVKAKLSNRQREEIVRSVWRNPQGWQWIHPFVDVLWARPRHPLHFGGPRPEPDQEVLREWIAGLALQVATPEEKMRIAEIERLTKAQRSAVVSRLREEDDARHDEAYGDMVKAWSADPKNAMDSPPDHVAVSWTEESRLLPSRWCGLMSDSTVWEDSLEAAPRWVVGYWRERGRDADALMQLLDAACIVSSLDPTLVDRLDRVVFAHAGLIDGYALVALKDGRGVLLEAVDGPFGTWTHRVDDLETLVDSLPDVDFARIALKRGRFGWSTRSHDLATHAEQVAQREGRTAKKPKLEPEKPRWVVHARHGRGLVVGSIPGPKGPKLVIEFESSGRKTLLHTFVEDE